MEAVRVSASAHTLNTWDDEDDEDDESKVIQITRHTKSFVNYFAIFTGPTCQEKREMLSFRLQMLSHVRGEREKA